LCQLFDDLIHLGEHHLLWTRGRGRWSTRTRRRGSPRSRLSFHGHRTTQRLRPFLKPAVCVLCLPANVPLIRPRFTYELTIFDFEPRRAMLLAAPLVPSLTTAFLHVAFATMDLDFFCHDWITFLSGHNKNGPDLVKIWAIPSPSVRAVRNPGESTNYKYA